MEVEGEDGSKFVLEKDVEAVFGRCSGFDTNDRTVSRHHVRFQLSRTEPRVSFEVIGRNPIWVLSKKNGTIRIFRKFKKAELEPGDRFCLSGRTPIWFNLKQTESQGLDNEVTQSLELDNEVTRSLESGTDFGDVDVSGIDPVKEFGFLVKGHDFDHYPKGMIRNVKDWEWFLEEPSKDSEDDDEEFEKKKRKGVGRKRKKGKDNEDEDWTGESEDDKNLVSRIRKGRRPGYSTRSKDSEGPNKNTKGGRNSKQKKASGVDETFEDEDDETLGGFIVGDEEEDLEEGDQGEEYEEGEFEEGDDDDDEQMEE